jgi:hypothetical protein
MYNFLEIKIIINSCQTAEELEKVLDAFIWLIKDGEKINRSYLHKVALQKYSKF